MKPANIPRPIDFLNVLAFMVAAEKRYSDIASNIGIYLERAPNGRSANIVIVYYNGRVEFRNYEK